MIKILLQCVPNHYEVGSENNLGDAAVIISTVTTLRQTMPQALFTSLIQLTESLAAKHNIKVVKAKKSTRAKFALWESLKAWTMFVRVLLWAALRKYFHLDAGILIKNAILKECQQADIIIDISMDTFNMFPIEISRQIMTELLLGKPVVIYAQTIRPLKGKIASWFAKLTLNRVSLITVREEISQRYLNKLGINRTPIYVTADPAFLLETAPKSRVNEIFSSFRISPDRPLIGITVPHVGELWGASKDFRGFKQLQVSIYNFINYLLPPSLSSCLMKALRKTNYYQNIKSQYKNRTLASIAKVADTVVEKTESQVVLIPSIVYPSWHDKSPDDDISVSHQVYELLSHKEGVIQVIGKYSAEETKGMIGQCDLFISYKFHPYVFATSQDVPTILVGSDPKMRGISALLGQER